MLSSETRVLASRQHFREADRLQSTAKVFILINIDEWRKRKGET